MKQNVGCVTWKLVKNFVVPLSVFDVATFEVSLLSIKRSLGPRCVHHFNAIFDSSETELFNNLDRVRLWRLVHAVTPCKILTGIVGINSDMFNSSIPLIILMNSFLHVIILNPKLDMRRCGPKCHKIEG